MRRRGGCDSDIGILERGKGPGLNWLTGGICGGGPQKKQTDRSVSFYLIKMIAMQADVSNTVDKRCLGSEVSRFSHLAKTLCTAIYYLAKNTAPT